MAPVGPLQMGDDLLRAAGLFAVERGELDARRLHHLALELGISEIAISYHDLCHRSFLPKQIAARNARQMPRP